MFGYYYTYDEEYTLHNWIAYGMILQAIPIYITLYYIIPSPWGKTILLNNNNNSSNSNSRNSSTLTQSQSKGTTRTTRTTIATTISIIIERIRYFLFAPSLPAKLSWCIMEIPNIVWCILCYYDRNHRNTNDTLQQQQQQQQSLPVHMYILSLFFIHYFYRSILYPFCILSSNTTYMPIIVVFMALTFCTFNGYLQAQGLCRPFVMLPTVYSNTSNHDIVPWERTNQFMIGTIIFFVGLFITIQSDMILCRLKDRQQTSATSTSVVSKQQQQQQLQSPKPKLYSIPYGGMFQYVSNPHYMGEIVEWIGYCIVSNYSIASMAFVLYTMSNLIPRAITNHKWYHQHFPTQYPKLHRKAIIPLIW